MKQKAQEKIQRLINKLLQENPHNLNKLQKLNGRIAVFIVQPVNMKLNCLFTEQGIDFMETLYAEPNVTIEGSPLGFLAMNLSENKLADIFAGKVNVTGDVDTAQKVQELFAELNIDWEEQLAQYTGDPIAHHVGKFARRGVNFAKRMLNTFQLNATEYLQEEIRLLPCKIEVEDFLTQVDRVRSDVDRLESRLKLLMDRPSRRSSAAPQDERSVSKDERVTDVKDKKSK